MAKKDKKLTCTFFLNGVQVDKLSPEHLEKMAQKLGDVMSIYYTAHLDEYRKINNK